jgi:hypothetical protein|nr:MAG TPA: hypothetical protein [Caudoviricetes sp.]
MFINSKKNFEIIGEGGKLIIPRGFIGSIPDWAAAHWLVQAAISDGSIATPEGQSDRAMEEADKNASAKAEGHDQRPDETGNQGPAEDQEAAKTAKEPDGTEKGKQPKK